jgi:cobalt-zinc-cadmium efflux system membrane fusion protein
MKLKMSAIYNINKEILSTMLVIIVIILSSCSNPTKERPSEPQQEQNKKTDNVTLTDAQYKTANIRLGSVEQKNISAILYANGKLDVPPQNMISISAPFGGFLKNTDLLQGKPVKKGELIAVIENPEYVQFQQDYLEAKSQLEFLETEYKRQEELSRENVNAQKTFQQAKAAWLGKEAIVNGLHAKLGLLNINFNTLDKGEISSVVNLYAPINGYVTEVNFNIGSFVNPSDVLFKIVDTSHLHAELTVFEKDVTKLKKGQKIRFTLPGDSKERLATVYLIGREISADRTVRIHCHLDQEDTDLLPGMYLNAVIELGNALTNVLPDKAIVDFEGKHYVFFEQKPMNFKMIEVSTGVSEQGYTEVSIPANAMANASGKLVVNGAYSLLSKMKNTEEE